jgi:hypothetical protein
MIIKDFRSVELAAKMDHSTDYWPSCGLVQYNNHTLCGDKVAEMFRFIELTLKMYNTHTPV